MNKIYVGNLLYSITEENLRDLFSQFGPIESIVLSVNGFGFVAFESKADAEKALALDGQEFEGRPLKVKIATPKEPADLV